MPINTTKQDATRQCCEFCGHFQEQTGSTGYCQYHHMYVLSGHDCVKFVPRDHAPAEQAAPQSGMLTNETNVVG